MVNNYQLRTTSYANRLSSPTCQLIMTSFMQNKPNFRKAKMNVTPALTKDYENIPPTKKCQNKPNTNPISMPIMRKQTQSNPISMPIMQKQTQFYPP